MVRQSKTLSQIYLPLTAGDDMENEAPRTCNVCQKHVETLKIFQKDKTMMVFNPDEIVTFPGVDYEGE